MKVRLWAGAAMAALALVAAGCGSSDNDSSTSSGDTGASTAAAASTTAGSSSTTSSEPTGAPIKIGNVSAQGSPIIDAPYQEAVVKAAAQGINARGGINGHPIEVVYCNDKVDPNASQACARQMAKEGVVATVGDIVLNGEQYMPILTQNDIPVVGLVAMTPQELNAKNSFPIDGGAQVATLFTTAYAMQSKVPTALLPADNPANLGLVKVIEATAKQAGGEFTTKVPIAANQTDYAPLVAAAQKNGTKAVLLQVSQPQAVQFIAAAEKAGAPFDTYFMTAALNDDQVKQLGPEAVDKVIYATGMPLLNSDNPLVKQYNEDLKAYEDESGNKDAYAAGNGGIAPWLALNAIADALKQQNVTDITAKSVAEALRNTKDLDLQGVTPPWTPDKAGPEGMVRLSNTSYYLAGYANGEPVLYTAQPVPFADAVAGTGLPAYPPKPAS